MRYTITAAIMTGWLALSMATASHAAAQSYTLDSEHTTVAFLIDHIGYAKTLGLFREVSGRFRFDQDTGVVSDISISVNTASVDTAHERRDRHVRNSDFLHVKQHPEMIFTADSATIDINGQADINGQLELLGQTQPLVLSVRLNKAEDYPFGHKRFTLGVSATGQVLRSDYGMDYGVANGLVGDVVDLIIEVEAIEDR